MREKSKIMKQPKLAAQIKICRDEMTSQLNAYYQTVTISIGLRKIFASDEPCSFKVNEPTMKTMNGADATPDVIFQCDNDAVGVVAEIKTTLPDDEEVLLQDIKEQIEKYSKIEKGWKTKNGKVDKHSILLLVDRLNSKRLDDLLKKWFAEGKISVDRSVCVAEWQTLRDNKIGMHDVILINHRSGTTDCSYFDNKLTNEIQIKIDDLASDYELRKFVRTKPPDLYLMEILYTEIFPVLSDGEKEFEITVDQMWKVLAEYYTSWSGLEGEQGQIRKNWLNKAMERFVDIELAVKVPEEPYKYKIISKKITKNVREYLLSKMCGKEKPVDSSKNQTILTEFSKNNKTE